MTISITQGIDIALKSLLYTKFADILGIDQESGSIADRINKGILQEPKEVALRDISEKRAEDFLEFISYYRMGTSPSWSRQRTVLARRGLWLTKTDGSKTRGINVKAQPVDLSYNVWFWSKDLDKVYQCIERYILWQQSYPKVDVSYEFDDFNSFSYSPDLHFGEIVDESTVAEKYNVGTMFIFKAPVKIDAWVLSGADLSGVINKITLTIYDQDDVTNYSEIIVEDSSQNVELEAKLRMYRRFIYLMSSVSVDDSSVVLNGDRSSDFNIGDKIGIEASTDNDGMYTVSSVEYLSGLTTLVVDELLASDIADGNLYKVEN